VKTSSLRGAVYLAAGLGLLVSLFSAAEFYTASLRSVCTINAFVSCSAVDQSGRTSTLEIPDYAWGIAGFVALMIVAGLAERRPASAAPAYGLVLLATAGVALSAYFIYVELAEIHALCIVCATAETLGVIVWAASIGLALRVRGEPEGSATLDRPPPTSEPE
jgi:uncharacterized membrane protein